VNARGAKRTSSNRAVDVITVRALRHAFHPDFEPQQAGQDLALVAGGALALRAARARVDDALGEQWSAVGSRAREALDHALRIVGPGPFVPRH
jgi:hypothetical protein